MGINVSDAYGRAYDISLEAESLRAVRRALVSYSGDISVSWSARETQYILAALESAIKKLDSAAAEMEGICSDVKRAAQDIRQEEIQRKRERIAGARRALDNAENSVRTLEVQTSPLT